MASVFVRLVGSLTVDESFSVLYAVASFGRIPGSIHSANVLYTGAACFFKGGTGLASFNSNRVDIATAWLRASATVIFI